MERNLSTDNRHRIALICSGGLDSVCLAYRLRDEGKLALIISFDYGQRHKRELDCARQCAGDLDIPFILSDIAGVGANLTGSALTDKTVAVPEGSYKENTMRQTIVPNRNAIFLAIAFGIAGARDLDGVALAVHSGDHYIYPDCTAGFLTAFDAMEDFALENKVRLVAPYAHKRKADIICDGAAHHVPFEKTWSCYKGVEIHCGRCGTCVERQEAFHVAMVKDPTVYKDPYFWKNFSEKQEDKYHII